MFSWGKVGERPQYDGTPHPAGITIKSDPGNLVHGYTVQAKRRWVPGYPGNKNSEPGALSLSSSVQIY
eukprot:3691556-Rhodomonas_salina.1